jgi:DNA-binding CsgD family transcriptional regulator
MPEREVETVTVVVGLVLVLDVSSVCAPSLLAASVWRVPRADSVAELVAVDRCDVGDPARIGVDGGRLVQSGLTVADVLTPREAEVFRELSKARSYAQIGSELHMAPETARKHTARICHKLGVDSRLELVGMSLASSLRLPG